MPINHFISPILRSIIMLVYFVAYASATDAGLRIIEMKDPLSLQPMRAALFFPTEATASAVHLGPLVLNVAKDAPLKQGKYPLILLSHGNSGSMFSHHDSAVFLAKQGYIVAAIEHPADNFRDNSGQGTDRVLIGRNLQIIAMLDFLLAQAPFSLAIDDSKVGVTGFSAGAYTALVSVGAIPRFPLLKNYCIKYPQNVLCVGKGDITLSSPPLSPKADQRIHAAFVMSPVAAFFNSDSLSPITVPVEIYAAGNDSALPIQDNAHFVKNNIPLLTKYTEIAKADHFVFLSPCTPQMQSLTPDLCVDPAGVDRQTIHTQINHDMVQFFNLNLLKTPKPS